MGLLTLIFASLLRPAPLASGFAERLPSAVGRTAALFTASSTCLNSKKAGSFNPFASFVGDMADSLMGNSVSANPQVDQAIAKISSSSWDDIRTLLESQMKTDDEKFFRANLEKGYGVASPLHKVRLFDESNKEEDIRVTFYRDSA